MFAEDDLLQRKLEREAADKTYNDALTALDQAMPGRSDLPHPPIAYDELQISPLNERWDTVGPSPVEELSGWRRKVAAFVWELVRPVFERQQAFNSVLVDHVNRNVAVHRANREAIASTIGALRTEVETLEAFHARLILFIQTITLYVDTKDRSEHIARLVNLTLGGHDAVSNELGRRWEAMVAREQRFNAAVDEVRTSIATIQQTGLTLKREFERLLQTQASPRPVVSTPSTPAPSKPAPPEAVPDSPSAAVSAHVNAYKYVGFENQFRGSEASIRERQRAYVTHFEGAADVLDLGCGRGEFLTLLHEHGIPARGLDINHEMVELCRTRGLSVDEGDALAFLQGLPDGSLGGLMAAQVVEHFQPPYLLRFLEVAYHKLRPGSAIVLETVNPSCWFAFFEVYLRDITHAWPLHPDTLKYLAVSSGFQRVNVEFLSPYPDEAKLQQYRAPLDKDTLGVASLIAAFNGNVDRINALLFGYLEYAVVARRL
jgi:SAM-dependent methyltransferase